MSTSKRSRCVRIPMLVLAALFAGCGAQTKSSNSPSVDPVKNGGAGLATLDEALAAWTALYSSLAQVGSVMPQGAIQDEAMRTATVQAIFAADFVPNFVSDA